MRQLLAEPNRSHCMCAAGRVPVATSTARTGIRTGMGALGGAGICRSTTSMLTAFTTGACTLKHTRWGPHSCQVPTHQTSPSQSPSTIIPLIYRTRASNQKSRLGCVGMDKTYSTSGHCGCVSLATGVANMGRFISQRQLNQPSDGSGLGA